MFRVILVLALLSTASLAQAKTQTWENGGTSWRSSNWMSRCRSAGGVWNEKSCNFLAKVVDTAYSQFPSRGINPTVAVVQACLETGFGRHFRHNNILGIKCYSSKAKAEGRCFQASTKEVEYGKTSTQNLWFKSFPTIEACLDDYGKFIGSERYKGAKKYIKDPVRTLTYIWASFYATAKNYVKAGVDNFMSPIFKATGITDFQGHISAALQQSIDRINYIRDTQSAKSFTPHKAARDREDKHGFGQTENHSGDDTRVNTNTGSTSNWVSNLWNKAKSNVGNYFGAKCASAGGNCIDTKSRQCTGGGSLVRGKCPGDHTILCCVPPKKEEKSSSWWGRVKNSVSNGVGWITRAAGNAAMHMKNKISTAVSSNSGAAIPSGSLWLTHAGQWAVEKLDRTDRRQYSFAKFRATPNKFLLHTIEGAWPRNGDYEGGTRTLDSKGYWPHFVLARDRQGVLKIGQYLPLDIAGRALSRHNIERVIQVEIGAKAGKPFTEHDEEITKAVAALWRALNQATGGSIPISVDPRVVFKGNGSYGKNGNARLTLSTFAAVAGLCGHQHAPDNSHWDPGQINPQKLIDLAAGGTNTGSTNTQSSGTTNTQSFGPTTTTTNTGNTGNTGGDNGADFEAGAGPPSDTTSTHGTTNWVSTADTTSTNTAPWRPPRAHYAPPSGMAGAGPTTPQSPPSSVSNYFNDDSDDDWGGIPTIKKYGGPPK